LARCLNPNAGMGHENPEGTLHCPFCDFLIQGAHIGIYEVISFIGAGSYGHVYKVREPRPLSRILALKVLRKDQFNAKAQASFFQEAQRIATMQHPNILPIYNFGQLADTQQPYFVMEYAPQTILDLYRDAQGIRRLAFAEDLIPYVQQTANALSSVHDHGLVHQDVKLGNLLIGRSGQILLADFGTAYYLGKQTHASLGEITGTAAYMPPEQWRGTPRRDSDQYALAVCCYDLLCGRPPFLYKELQAMWQAHAKEQPPSLQRWNPRVPAEVTAVILRALAKDYHRRYTDINEFAEQFTQAVKVAQQRYVCQMCGQQNRTGAQRCAFCGTEYDDRTCPHCSTPIRLGQRCCPHCGRLTFLLHVPPEQNNPLLGISVRQGRYTITRLLTQSPHTTTMTSVATDTRNHDQPVVLKRWECTAHPIAQRAQDIAYYEQATLPLQRLHHPLLPVTLDRFAEGQHYYVVLSYIQGESIEERLARTLHPLPEKEMLNALNMLLNVLIVLEKQRPAIYHYDISPANIFIEPSRGRAYLTGFQISPPPHNTTQRKAGRGVRTTRKLAVSPYLPIGDKPYDQRTSIYALAASMHHALTNVAPPHYPAYPPVRVLNPTISPALETILNRALLEESAARYQSYAAMQRDVQHLLTV